MTNVAHDHNVSRAKVEHIALARIVDRLARRFPDQPVEDITRAVQSEHKGYAHSRVRNYIPILIERAVRARLATKTPRHRA